MTGSRTAEPGADLKSKELHVLGPGVLRGKTNAFTKIEPDLPPDQGGLMESLARALELLFGCHHRNVSRVFTIGGQTYRVCWECGTKFHYSLASMSIEHRALTPRVTALRQVPTS